MAGDLFDVSFLFFLLFSVRSGISDFSDKKEASLIGVDIRFFKDIAGKFNATRAGQAAVYRGEPSTAVLYDDNDAASIKATVHKLLGKK